MSQQIVSALFEDVGEAHVKDHAFTTQVGNALDTLDRGLRIGSWRQIQEWKGDWDDPKDQHRHVSHLFALYPGREISPLFTPQLANAARVTLAARGDESTGWSRAWKVNFWARLRDGDHAHGLLAGLLRDSTLPNLWDTHPPFQIDGNFGAIAGMTEMLLQSRDGEIDILPALPSNWPSGEVDGLRARGDVTVDIVWHDGLAQSVVLRAGHTGPLTIRSTILAADFELTDQTSGKAVAMDGHGPDRWFAARAGHTYLLRRNMVGP